MGGPNKKWAELSEEQKQKRRDSSRKWYYENKERHKELSKASFERHGHTWASKTKEYCNKKSKEFKKKVNQDPERRAKYLAKKREWTNKNLQENHDAVRGAWNIWRRNNSETYNQRRREYWKLNPDKLSKIAIKKKNVSLRYKEQAFDIYGGYCKCCGEDHIAFLSIDHINNDGNVKRRSGEHAGGHRMYRYIVKNGYSSEFQLLCMNCNWAKRLHGECPHKMVALHALNIDKPLFSAATEI